MNRILINCLGIKDSGGISVLNKLLSELNFSCFKILIIHNKNKDMEKLYKKYMNIENFEFLVMSKNGFFQRLYVENIIFRKIIREKKINLIYNFSGTAQFFLKVPQLTKVHNLLFYSKKIDKVYIEKKEYLKWFKQIFLKRIAFHILIGQSSNIEIQSLHVKKYMNDFIDTDKKDFFIKSDIEIDKSRFLTPKSYDFGANLRFLFIVGPHFEYLHKNLKDFVKMMLELNNTNKDFEIIITLTEHQLNNSKFWDKSLNEKTNFLGYVSKEELKKQFQDNTILVSTSVIETLGLHVIEASQNGILSIVPNEVYAKNVYGNDIPTYELFDVNSFIETYDFLSSLDNNKIKDIILKNQDYLIKNENKKYSSITDVFDEILKVKNVQR